MAATPSTSSSIIGLLAITVSSVVSLLARAASPHVPAVRLQPRLLEVRSLVLGRKLWAHRNEAGSPALFRCLRLCGRFVPALSGVQAVPALPQLLAPKVAARGHDPER